MSTALSALLPERVRPNRPERHLRPLDMPGKRRRPKLVYAVTAVVGAVVIGMTQLGLSMATTQTTYEIRNLTEQNRALKLEGQALYDDVAGLSSPQYLAANASAAGMVVGGSPTYLRLSDGAVIGGSEAVTTSSIDARRAAVSNSLVANTPLVTSPKSTMSGQTKAAVPVATTVQQAAAIDALPTPVIGQVEATNPKQEFANGLPVPQTR